MKEKPNFYAIIPASVRYDKDLTANAKLLYGEITALCNAEGYCWASNNYFAELYGMSLRHISRLISQLHKKGYVKVVIVNDFDRKIYLTDGLVNSAPHDKNDVPHDKNVMGVGQKCHGGYDKNVQPPLDKNVYKNNTSINTTLNTTTNNKKTNKKEISPAKLEKEFDALWSLYPKKHGKQKALQAFTKARKIKKIPYEEIENGLYRYIGYLEQQGTEERYIMHGSTWFNQEKWQDEYILTGIKQKPKNINEYMRQKYGDGGFNDEPARDRKIIPSDNELLSELF